MNPSTSSSLEDILMGCKCLEHVVLHLENFSSDGLLLVARNSLDNFMLANFAGWIDECPSFVETLSEERIIEDLSFGCNSPFKFARSKFYLWLAKEILIDRRSHLDDGFEKSQLTSRLVLLWQYLLSEPAVQLKRILDALDDVPVDYVHKLAASEALVERMYAHLMYNQISRAEFCLNNALDVIDLKIGVTGVLGKRTRFQETFIPQLIASAEMDSKLTDDAPEDESTLPPNVLLHDDSLLETVCTIGKDASSSRDKLPAIGLACMLASGVFERKIQSVDEALVERCCSYLDEVIAQRENWAVQASALLQRCEFEKTRMRRVERACMQMEALSKLMNGFEAKKISGSTMRKRLKLLLASGLKPFWYVDALHAEILHSIGCTSEALTIYEKQGNWDGVISCYHSLGKLEKAEPLIRDLIAKNEKEPKYWCILGDVLHEPHAYEKAIEVSNDRSFRAHRSLGMLMLDRKHYDIAYKHLKRAVELQPINASTWFNFGCCAWGLKKWEEAARAYRECVRYEPAHFQAWNNLAAVYEKLDDLERAKRLLQEALKLNFEHTKMRENYMLLCIRTYDLSSAITSFHVLLDSNRQYKDDTVIDLLTRQLITLRQEDEEAAKPLIGKMCELLGRITSQQTSSATVWRCYAELKRPSSKSSIGDYEVYTRLLERSFRASQNKQDWHKSEDLCIVVLDAVMKLIEAKKVLAEMKDSDNSLVESEIRMILRPMVASVEKVYGADAVEASSNRLKECLSKVKAAVSSYL